MQMSYQDCSHQVQVRPDLPWLIVRNFESMSCSSDWQAGIGQHKTPTQDGTVSAQLTVKDYATVTLSFTVMLLKRVPDVMDTNPIKLGFNIAKIVLQIINVRCCSSHHNPTDYAYQAVKDNINTIDWQILLTVIQLHMMEEALDGWWSNNLVEEQGLELYKKCTCIFL
jgi:hypothetical protein